MGVVRFIIVIIISILDWPFYAVNSVASCSLGRKIHGGYILCGELF